MINQKMNNHLDKIEGSETKEDKKAIVMHGTKLPYTALTYEEMNGTYKQRRRCPCCNSGRCHARKPRLRRPPKEMKSE